MPSLTSRAKASEGRGLLKWKPWIWSHPRSRRKASCEAVSTPSAMTSRRRFWARPTMAASSAPSLPL